MIRPVPYPADTRAKGWRFELDHERIEQSDTWALAPSDVKPWLLMLWVTAWRQEPCGSLPNEDELIAVRIGMPMRIFAKVRSKLMRGWWEAEDGRLYHDDQVTQVLAMLAERHRRGHLCCWDEVIAKHGARCFYCGSSVDLTLDHVLPRIQGGSDEARNLVPACRRCNSAKGGRTPEEWGR